MAAMQPTVAISQEFLGAFARIPKSQQKKVMEFMTKFRSDPFSSGINYEKINDARDNNFRSVRIDQDYRGIVLKPDEGDVYVLLWVDKHDAAYDWARRHSCGIHPQTGNLQLLEVDHEKASTQFVAADIPSAPESVLLFKQRDRELLRLGVPESMLAEVQALASEEALEALESRLPREAFEALYLLAAGVALDEVEREYAATITEVDTDDFAAALRREHSQRNFVVVDDDQALQAIMEAPLEKWRVFLHPSQRRLVAWDCAGPVRVLGGAGTGKTVVAMHRARWLLHNSVSTQDRKVLFTTFTANLATDIQASLRRFCSPEEMERIEVTHIDAWVARFLKGQGYPHQIVYEADEKYKTCWAQALDARSATLDFPESFYREEWERVILPQRVTERQQYFSAKRTGRGVALTRKQRSEIWPVFEEMRIGMHQRGLRTIEDATTDAADLLESKHIYLPYDAIVVDEAQDMGPQVMTLLRKMVPPARNDLFIVGDGHQRIYRRPYALSLCGIEVRGRSRKLRINYRTTEETRRFAISVLEGLSVDDLDGGEDTSQGYRSLLHGDKPMLQGFSNVGEEGEWIAGEIRALLEGGIEAADICLVARTHQLLSQYESILADEGLASVKLTRARADNRAQDGIRLATMHRVKGLEFRYVFIAGVSEGQIPLRQALEHTVDVTERRASEASERALLHVAATRAIKGLWVTWYGKKSQFLGVSVD